MNRLMEEKWSWVEGCHGMRTGLLETLSDTDLGFSPDGGNMTLGELLRENGEIEYTYIQSLKTFKTDWSYRNTEDGMTTHLSKLTAWFETLDADLKATLSAFSNEELSQLVERRGGYSMPIEMQVEVYLQAMFIFFGKATVYWRAMDKELPPSVKEYIG